MTGAIHANIGTGAYPKTHGVPTNIFFVDGNPENLRVPTIGDVWDREQGNAPIVGAVTVLSTQLGMLGLEGLDALDDGQRGQGGVDRLLAGHLDHLAGVLGHRIGAHVGISSAKTSRRN